ncbi:hypothetical protein OE88DRAFT_1664485 [Heliocybe sulcata]|uniref:BTB domain-containing protein n=1 Tax=Heliocybe sulcata TaxID=5364 RepID=A0A5C3MU20_9AGAM|nr:hypothetical protein OE88DRAFT_1664485 [Heliocybe sulcata]
MLSLPRYVKDAGHAEQGKIPVVDVTEDRNALDILLRLCFPGEVPELRVLDDVKIGLEVSRKYDVHGVTAFLRRSLISPTLLEDAPLRVYAIAYLYELPQETLVAAKASLRLRRAEVYDPVGVPELCTLPTLARIRLTIPFKLQ